MIEPGVRAAFHALVSRFSTGRRSPMCWCSPPPPRCSRMPTGTVRRRGLSRHREGLPAAGAAGGGGLGRPFGHARSPAHLFDARRLRVVRRDAVLLGCTHYPLIAAQHQGRARRTGFPCRSHRLGKRPPQSRSSDRFVSHIRVTAGEADIPVLRHGLGGKVRSGLEANSWATHPEVRTPGPGRLVQLE